MNGVMLIARCCCLWAGLLLAQVAGWARWFMLTPFGAVVLFVSCLAWFLRRFALV